MLAPKRATTTELKEEAYVKDLSPLHDAQDVNETTQNDLTASYDDESDTTDRDRLYDETLEGKFWQKTSKSPAMMTSKPMTLTTTTTTSETSQDDQQKFNMSLNASLDHNAEHSQTSQAVGHNPVRHTTQNCLIVKLRKFH